MVEAEENHGASLVEGRQLLALRPCRAFGVMQERLLPKVKQLETPSILHPHNG
jgi:hypothetical protein